MRLHIAIWEEVQNCIYFVFGSCITQNCEHGFLCVYEMNVSFVGGCHFMWCWNYSLTDCILSREVIGVKSIACVKIYVQSGGCLVIYSALIVYVDSILAQFTSAILFYLELLDAIASGFIFVRLLTI